MSVRTDHPATDLRPGGLPTAALLVMALTGFLLIATETMPAGLLPQISAGLGVSEGTAGQYVSAYALGTVVCAVPAVTLTRGFPRRPVLLAAVAVFLVATGVTAVSSDVALSLAARFVAGACSGLLWGMLAGYARRISSPEQAGRALAVASLGTPVGLALGTPLGSWLGSAVGWRWSFAATAALALLVLGLVVLLVPAAPGQRAETREPLHRVVRLPGVAPVLVVILLWMVGHNTLYTYVSAYLRTAGVGVPVEVALVVFGGCALLGLWVTGVLIDRALRRLVLLSVAAFVVTGVTLLLASGWRTAVVAAIVLWGLAFGGAAAQLQTAVSEAAGENADVANSFVGTAFNLAIFAAGVLGALLVSADGGRALPAVLAVSAAGALVVVLVARRAAFPVGR